MTRRALIVIAVIVLLPMLFVGYKLMGFNEENRVVAEYGNNVDIIEYDGKILYKVSGVEYNFRFGEYLGKVGDSLTGAPLYLVADDASGKYYAIAEGKEKILYTESGELVDGVRTPFSRVTRFVLDDYLVEEENLHSINMLTGIQGRRVSVDLSDYKNKYKYYDVYLSFDESAILTEYYGRFVYLTEKELWLFVTSEDVATAEEKYGGDLSETVYVADMLTDEEAIELLNSYFSAD